MIILRHASHQLKSPVSLCRSSSSLPAAAHPTLTGGRRGGEVRRRNRKTPAFSTHLFSRGCNLLSLSLSLVFIVSSSLLPRFSVVFVGFSGSCFYYSFWQTPT
ncbi:unnamed protein product [Musa banksii]